ncbi:MAG: hypothetical protein JWM95_439 [Gemmatimonadetes bacterium]|nr:hypothetical protein [Gemmatimonadota bacterium]
MILRPASALVGADLHIRLKRHTDTSASLTLTRRDGTVTWQRQKGSLALVFPRHDLTHYAIESTLGYRSAFYGLVADGWEIADFATPWPRGPIPVEAREVEMLVGLFDGMRPERATWNAADINRQLEQLVVESKFTHITPRVLADDDVAAVRQLRNSVLERWHATEPGNALELEFNRRIDD